MIVGVRACVHARRVCTCVDICVLTTLQIIGYGVLQAPQSSEEISTSALPLLDAVVKESLRLHPTAPFIGREISKPLEIRIPAGSGALVGSDPSVRTSAAGAIARLRGISISSVTDEDIRSSEVVYTIPAGAVAVVDINAVHTNPLVRCRVSVAQFLIESLIFSPALADICTPTMRH
jgi:hypothetical protein